MRIPSITRALVFAAAACGAANAHAFDYEICNDTGKSLRFAVTSLKNGDWVTDAWRYVGAEAACTKLTFSSSPIFVRAEDTELYLNHWDGRSLFCVNDVGDAPIQSSGATCGNAYGEYRAQFFEVRAAMGATRRISLSMENARYVGKSLEICNRTDAKARFHVGFRIGRYAPLSTNSHFPIEAGACLTYDFPNFDAQFYVAAENGAAGLHWGDQKPLCVGEGYEFDVEDPSDCFVGAKRFDRVAFDAEAGKAFFELRHDNAITVEGR